MRKLAVALALFCICFFTKQALAADEALPKAAAPLLDAMKGLTDAAQTSLSQSRTSERAKDIRAVIYRRMLGAHDGSEKLNISSLMCDPRGNHAAAVATRGYLLQVSGVVTKTATVEINGLLAAFQSLADDPKIDPVKEVKTSDIKKATIDACSSDLKNAPKFFVGQEEVPRAGAIDSLVSLFTLISGIVQTAVVDSAKLVATQRRKQVIQQYLSNETTATSIENAATNLLSEVTHSINLDRTNAAGNYLSAAAALDFAISASMNSAKKECELFSTSKELGSADFWACWNSIWSKGVQDASKNVLTTAAAYDALADAGVAFKVRADTAIHKAFVAIRAPNSSFSLQEILALGSQLVGIAQDYEKKYSPKTIGTRSRHPST